MIASTYPFRRLIRGRHPAGVRGRGETQHRSLPAGQRRPVASGVPRAGRRGLRVPSRSAGRLPLQPFPGAVLERVVANLEASLGERPRQAAVIYVNPHALSALRQSQLFERVPTIADRMPLVALGARDYECRGVRHPDRCGHASTVRRAMKLLLCSGCHDVVALVMDERRTCRCGASSGRYRDDGWDADVWVLGRCSSDCAMSTSRSSSSGRRSSRGRSTSPSACMRSRLPGRACVLPDEAAEELTVRRRTVEPGAGCTCGAAMTDPPAAVSPGRAEGRSGRRTRAPTAVRRGASGRPPRRCRRRPDPRAPRSA